VDADHACPEEVLPGGDQHAGWGKQLALSRHCCGLRGPVPCSIAAHHAYLSSSALSADSLLHTSFLHGECGMFRLATYVPSLHSIVHSSSHSSTNTDSFLFLCSSLYTVSCSTTLAHSLCLLFASVCVSQSTLVFLPDVASGFDFLESLSVMINFFNKSVTAETCCLRSQSSEQMMTGSSVYFLAARRCSC